MPSTLFQKKKWLEKVDQMGQEINADFSRQLEVYREKITAMESMPDAGERYKSLLDIEEQIQKFGADIKTKIDEAARKLPDPEKANDWGKAISGISFTTTLMLATLTATDVFFTGGVITGIAAAFGGASIFFPMAHNRRTILAAYKNISVKGTDTSINTLLQETANLRATILKNEFDALGASPHFNDLYDRVTAIRDAFIKAATAERYAAAKVLKISKPAPKKPKTEQTP